MLHVLVALSLLVGCNSLAPPSPSTQRNQVPSATVVEDIAPSSSVENDSSRRLFVTGVVGLGLLAGMGETEAVEAALLPAAATTSEQPRKGGASLSSSSTMMTSEAAAAAAAPVDWKAITQKASKRALGGGKAGASAAVVQVLSLMWLRTSMNYQVSKQASIHAYVLDCHYKLGLKKVGQTVCLQYDVTNASRN